MGDVFRELDHMRLNLLQSIGELGRVNMQLVAVKAGLEDRVAERTAGLEAANRELDPSLIRSRMICERPCEPFPALARPCLRITAPSSMRKAEPC